MYPNNFCGKRIFLNQKKNICNFILSDETHLGFTLKASFSRITNKKKINNIEEFIHVSDLIKLILKTLFNFYKFSNLCELRHRKYGF